MSSFSLLAPHTGIEVRGSVRDSDALAENETCVPKDFVTPRILCIDIREDPADLGKGEEIFQTGTEQDRHLLPRNGGPHPPLQSEISPTALIVRADRVFAGLIKIYLTDRNTIEETHKRTDAVGFEHGCIGGCQTVQRRICCR